METGQNLGKLDDALERSLVAARGFDAEAARARAALLRAGARREEIRAMRAELEAARVRESQLKATLERDRALAKAGVRPRVVVENDESRYRAAVAERSSIAQRLAALRAGARPEEMASSEAVASAAAAAAAAEARQLERHTLVAPTGGEVLEVFVEPGEIVAAGAPVLTIADTARPFADVFVPQGELGGIHIGSQATIAVDGLPSRLTGVVEFVSRRTEFTPRFLFSERERPNLVIRVRIRIEDPEKQLHAGIPAFVAIERGRRHR